MPRRPLLLRLPSLVPALLLALLLALLVFARPAGAQDGDGDEALPSIAEKTEGLTRRGGFVPVYWDAQKGRVWLEIGLFDTDLLHVVSLPGGLGSNDIGLDRGQLGPRRVVRFERVGPRVLLVAPNLDYRATTANPAERRAVRDAFAEGVLWGFDVAAEAADGQRVLVDATAFLLADAHGIARRLEATGQGSFGLDASRSAPVPALLKAFPDNTELEARLTFTTDGEVGGFVRDVAAVPRAVTLRQRHAFVRLPALDGPAAYAPRRFHPRSGYFPTTYRDYAVPIGASIPQRFITRHRLTRDAAGAVAAPIVYYLDPGTPEPVRSALLDGARWWTEAFAAAGFPGGFRVEVLPDSADAQDVRYHTIQWVHRATRGWSYGASVTDPRTGEILKGHVTLGSLRVRQDYLLAEGLLAPYVGEHADGFPPDDDPMLQMALARLRQLAAHEVGHTLGLAHNFAASTQGRTSVMDYPAPLATPAGADSVALDGAYDAGLGAWDVWAIRYGYAPTPDSLAEDAWLGRLLAEQAEAGLRYVTDADARPPSAAHPHANLWDNGADPVAALRREMAVRAVALERFGEAVIRRGAPMATMEDVLVPLYLRHRYQVEATAKLLGGVTYAYTLRGDDARDATEGARDATEGARDATEGVLAPPTRVAAEQQTAALDGLLATLTPGALRLPEAARTQIPPRPPGYASTRELFPGRAGPTLDPLAPAEVATAMVAGALLQPGRALRLVHQHDADPALPSFRAVLGRATEALWKQPPPADAHDAELQRTVQHAWTTALVDHAARADAAPAVRARLRAHLQALDAYLAANAGRDAETQAHRAAVRAHLARFLGRTQETATPPACPHAAPRLAHRGRGVTERAGA